MSLEFPEPDWRVFKTVQEKLMQRFCSGILEGVVAASLDTAGKPHERYLKVYQLIAKRDKEIGHAFNDFRRSTALQQLLIMRKMKLLADEDLSLFSERIRTQIATWDAL